MEEGARSRGVQAPLEARLGQVGFSRGLQKELGLRAPRSQPSGSVVDFRSPGLSEKTRVVLSH